MDKYLQFMDAKILCYTLYMWTSIVLGRELGKKDLRLRFDNGRNIIIYRDQWLLYDGSSITYSPLKLNVFIIL